MSDIKYYTGTKTVMAKPMTRQAYNDYRCWSLPADEDGSDDGYLVEYTDGGKPNVAGHKGYVSWSPKEQFEGAYKEIAARTEKSCGFAVALEMLKDGKRVQRAGWDGQGMYVYHVPAASYPAQTEIAQREFGDMVPYRAYLALKTAQGDVAVWVPSITDILADDWYLV